MATSIRPEMTARPPPPSTPRRGGTEQINRIVAELNREFPSLGLRLRIEHESPSSRQNAPREICYDRITFYYFRQPDELQAALSNFRYEIRKGAANDPIITLLNCLPLDTSPRRRTPMDAPIPMSTRFDEEVVRPCTPDLVEDDDVPPLSPSPSARRADRLMSSIGKRPSTDDPDILLGRAAKVSRASEDSYNSVYYTPPPASPTEPYSPIDAATGLLDVSFGSTVRDLDGTRAVDTSFRTDITVPDADCTQQSEVYASTFSLNTQVLQATYVKRSSSEKTSRGSNISSKLRAVDQWVDTIEVSAKAARTSASTGSYGTTLSSETREAFAQVANIPLASSVLQPDASPTQGLAHLSLRSPSQRLDNATNPVKKPNPQVSSYQISRLAHQGLFVPTACEGVADFRVLWECYRLHTISKINLPSLLDIATRSNELSDIVPDLLNEFPVLARTEFKRTATAAWASECISPNLQLKARLVFNTSASQSQLFQLELLPLEISLSCRFQRKFGNDRVLYLEVPDLDSCPSCFAGKQELPQKFADWLHPSQEKVLLGREWRALHLEQLKTKKKRKDGFGGYRVVLIATAGPGLKSLSMSSILDFFMDTRSEGNLRQSFRKAYSRLDLGFSKTEATYTFLPSQIIRVPDKVADPQTKAQLPPDLSEPSTDWSHVPNKNNRVMDDGVNIISVGAAKAVCKSLGVKILPTAFQARLAGAKGMWSLSGPPDSTDEEDLDTWIKINDSQWKFDVSTADNDDRFDKDRWTFEVLKISGAKGKFGSLHVDLIPLLYDRGVKVGDIEQVVAESLTQTGHELMEAFEEASDMKRWLHKHCREEDGSRDEENTLAGVPHNMSAEANFLLDSGFAPKECKHLSRIVQTLAKDVFDRAIKNPAYDMTQSVNLQAVADPLGVLAPNEIHVAFSTPRNDDASGKVYSWLDGQEVLVSRHPMQMPSDVQKVHTRYCQELSHYLDVVVVPITGPWSLVALLQGGDLDGDTYTVIWHPTLVKDFVNCPPSRDLFDTGQSEDEVKRLTLEYFGVRREQRTLSQVLVGPDPASNFLYEGMRARLLRVPLGQVTIFATYLAYALGPAAYASRAMRLLAQLYTILIDADKNGYYYSSDDLKEYINRETEFPQALHSKGKKMTKNQNVPAYIQVIKQGVDADFKVPLRDFKHPSDVVVIDHIRPQILTIRQRINELVEKTGSSDSHLTSLSRHYESQPDDAIRSEIQALKAAIKMLKARWGGEWSLHFDKSSQAKSSEDTGISQRCTRIFNDIQPLNPKHPIVASWLLQRLPNEPTLWSLIKASVSYAMCEQDGKMAFSWSLAGGDLAYIKARSSSGSRLMVRPIRTILKPRKRRVGIMLELDERSNHNTGQGVSDDTGEDFQSADEGQVEGEFYA